VFFCLGECGTLLGQNVLYLKAHCDIDHNWKVAAASVGRTNGYGCVFVLLFCRVQSLLQGSFEQETYTFKETTNRSHPIVKTECTFHLYGYGCGVCPLRPHRHTHPQTVHTRTDSEVYRCSITEFCNDTPLYFTKKLGVLVMTLGSTACCIWSVIE